MVWTDLEWSRQVQSGPGWSRRVWKVCGLGGQILTQTSVKLHRGEVARPCDDPD